MLNLKADDFGLEPNVTGFEESVNLAYLDGKREGYDEGYAVGKKEGRADTRLEVACNCLKLGVDAEIISEATGLDLQTIKNLK